jgi:hypothetical protein
MTQPTDTQETQTATDPRSRLAALRAARAAAGQGEAQPTPGATTIHQATEPGAPAVPGETAYAPQTTGERAPGATATSAATSEPDAGSGQDEIDTDTGTAQRSHDWPAIRARWEAGETAESLARAFDLRERLIHRHKAAEGWQRVTPQMQVSTCTLDQDGSDDGRHAGDAIEARQPAAVPTDATLMAVGDALAGLIEAGLPQIAPPATLKQLATAVSTYRQARGIGSGPQQQGARVLINLGAGVRVRETPAHDV